MDAEKTEKIPEGYISVRLFADEAEVIQSAVYNRIEKLQEEGLAKRIDNKWYISRDALSKFNVSRMIRRDNTRSNTDDLTCCEDANADVTRYITELKESNVALKEENERLVRQNIALHDRIAENDIKIAEFAEKFAELARQAIDTVGRAQALHAAQIVSVAEHADDISGDTDGVSDGENVIDGDTGDAETEGKSTKKPSWRSRLIAWLAEGEKNKD
jgi:DNA-binding Lrp family transcriptional regulator